MSSKRHITATLADTRWEFKRCCVCAGTGSRRALMGSRKVTLPCRECGGTGYLRYLRPLSRETRQERPTWQPGKARTVRVIEREDGK